MKANTSKTRKKLQQVVSSTTLEVVDKANEHDVICGRGLNAKHYLGNKNFRRVAWHYKEEYLQASRDYKRTIASRVLTEIAELDPPGRILVPQQGGSLFVIADKDRAVEKVCQFLREKNVKAPEGMPSPFERTTSGSIAAKHRLSHKNVGEKAAKTKVGKKDGDSDDEYLPTNVKSKGSNAKKLKSSDTFPIRKPSNMAFPIRKPLNKVKSNPIPKKASLKMAPIKIAKATKRSSSRKLETFRRSLRLTLAKSLEEECAAREKIAEQIKGPVPEATIPNKRASESSCTSRKPSREMGPPPVKEAPSLPDKIVVKESPPVHHPKTNLALPSLNHKSFSATLTLPSLNRKPSSTLMPSFLRAFSSASFRPNHPSCPDSFEASLEGITEPPPLVGFSSGFSFGSAFNQDHVPPPAALQPFNSLFIEGMPAIGGGPIDPDMFLTNK